VIPGVGLQGKAVGTAPVLGLDLDVVGR
jgi:hypothetical protein